jgi:secreted trypsin-like serine protease
VKKMLSAFLLFSLCFGINQPAHAIMGGESAKGDDRIVPIYAFNGNNKYMACSGYLFAPRIVITAAHCMFKPFTTKARWPDRNMYVGPPGKVVNERARDHLQAEKVFWYKDYDGIRPKGRYDNKDFAVIVLKKPASKVSWARMQTKAEYQKWRDNLGSATVGGYGYSSYAERSRPYTNFKYPRKLTLPFATFEHWNEAVWVRDGVDIFGQNEETYEEAGWMFISKELGTTCDGDSGAGFYIEGKRDIYVGLNAWARGSHNCEKHNSWSPWGALNRVDPIHNHEKLLRQAIAYAKGRKGR